jgi:glycosyltransferase involved in cell wall biosynthesis
VHGSDFLLLDAYPARRGRTLEALEQADGIIAVSEDLRNRMIQAGIDGAKIEVIYDGVDRDQFCPASQADARSQLGVPADAKMILFVGNLVKVKGIEVLIEAFRQLQSDSSEAICYLIGHGKLRRRLEKKIRSEKLAARIKLLGGRPHAELPNWYRAADLLVLPSYSEGVPCVLLEAAACGTPFVASSVGGIPEIAHLGPNQLVPPGDPAALCNAMQQMLRAPRSSQPAQPGRVRPMSEAVAQIEAYLVQVLAARRRSAGNEDLAVGEARFIPTDEVCPAATLVSSHSNAS